MVERTVHELRKVLNKRENIRNIYFFGDANHGACTLTASLSVFARIGIAPKFGDHSLTERRQNDGTCRFMLKAAELLLNFTLPEGIPLPKGAACYDFLIRVIEPPPYCDVSSEITSALRLADGSVAVIDPTEGPGTQTERQLLEVLAERIKPVLVLNKLDRYFLEFDIDLEHMYQSFTQVIDDINVLLAVYQDEALGDVRVYPDAGTVAFSSGLHSWAFTLTTFAGMYSKKFGVGTEKMTKRLWGDNFFNRKTKKWSKNGRHGGVRAFCEFILKPIKKIIDLAMSESISELEKILVNLGIELSTEEREVFHFASHARPRRRMRLVLQKWLPIDRALLEIMVLHLPSPISAQVYRANILYEGPIDDACCTAIRQCDPHGPLMVYISKTIPSTDNGRFIAYGRVFSGTVRAGMKVRIMSQSYTSKTKSDISIQNIKSPRLILNRHVDAVESVPCGNTVGLVCLAQHIASTATVTDADEAFPLKSTKHSLTPVLQVAVEPENPSRLPKLVKALDHLDKSNPLVQIRADYSGNYVILGACHGHLKMAIASLTDSMNGDHIRVSDPIAIFRETVEGGENLDENGVCVVTSPNKMLQLSMSASPLTDKYCNAIESGKMTLPKDKFMRAKVLHDEFGIDEDIGKRIWCFGPRAIDSNFLCDGITSVRSSDNIKDDIMSSCVVAFQWATREGILCDEEMRGTQFSMLDCRGPKVGALWPNKTYGSQLMPTCRTAVFGAQLMARPRLKEPMYQVDIHCARTSIGAVYRLFSTRRGDIIDQLEYPHTNLIKVTASLPVQESSNFAEALYSTVSGDASFRYNFDQRTVYWSTVPGDATDPSCTAGRIVQYIRKRKGLKEGVPDLAQLQIDLVSLCRLSDPRGYNKPP